MSLGYNLVYDYPYVRDHQAKVIAMEKANPLWQPQLYGKGSVSTGKKSVGFNNYSVFSPYYESTPKSYKSSGNLGEKYYNRNELEEINKGNFPSINYEKNQYNNSRKDMSADDAKIYDSIKKMVKDTHNYGQLRGGASLDEMTGLYKLLMKSAIKSGLGKDLDGGALNLKKFEKKFRKELEFLENVGDTAVKVAPTAIKVSLPLVSGAVAQSLGVPAPVGVIIGKVAADVLANKIINNKALEKKSKMKGEGIKQHDDTLSDKANIGSSHIEMDLFKMIMSALKSTEKQHGNGMSGGKLNKKSFGDAFKNELRVVAKGAKIAEKVSKKVAPIVVKEALTLAASAAADELGLPKPVGALVSKLAAEVIVNEVLAKSKGADKIKGVGKYEGGAKSDKGAKKEGDMSKRQRRCELVKKIMAQQKCSLPEASKYIKNNNMEY